MKHYLFAALILMPLGAYSAEPAPEPVTFLGVMAIQAPKALSTQLGRPAGLGLVVVSVQPNSPAAAALKIDDLLVRLDDQQLVNMEQLTALIRSHKEGDEVAVTFVRAGKEESSKVRLTRQAGVAPIAGMISVSVTNPEYFIANPELAEALSIEDLRKRVSGGGGGGGGGGTSMRVSSSSNQTGETQSINYSDSSGRIEIATINGHKQVTVRNPAGAVTFSGPFDTDAERALAPASVQARVAEVEARVVTTDRRVPRAAPGSPPSRSGP